MRSVTAESSRESSAAQRHGNEDLQLAENSAGQEFSTNEWHPQQGTPPMIRARSTARPT